MTSYRNVVLFLVLAAAWGSAFMAIKAGLQYFPPVLFAALRYDVAGVIMFAYAVTVTDQWIPRTRGEWVLAVIGGVLMIAAYHVFLFIGELNTTSAAAAVIVGLSPVLTTGFARVLLPSSRLTVLGTIGMFLGFVGVVIIAQPDPDMLLETDVVAKFLVFMAALSFSFGSVLARRVEASLPIETMEAWAMLIGAVVMHAVSFGLAESPSAIEWTAEAFGALGYLSLVASAVGFLIYFDLLDRLGPVEINLVSYVAPVFAAVTGWLWLGEIVDAATVAGFVVIVTGFALLKRREIARELGW